MLMIVCREAPWLESLVLAIKDSGRDQATSWCLLHSFASRLLECARSCLPRGSNRIFRFGGGMDFQMRFSRILAWPWHIKLKTLTIKDLIVIESWGSLIKTNILT